MSDFASAAMVRLLAEGMRAQGLDPGPLGSEASGARVDLDLKRRIVGAAVAQAGMACLPLLGRGLHRFTHEPTHQALTAARHARDLFERWQRLERYIHSRHRCAIVACEGDSAEIRHGALGGGGPTPAEDLVVAGVLAALLEAIGLQRVAVSVGGAPAYPEPSAAAIDAAVRGGTTADWRFQWRGAHPAAAGPTARDGADIGIDLGWSDTARTTYRRIAADLLRPPGLQDLARTLGMPWRTLQRRLGEEGLSYSFLLAEARCRAGAWRLQHTRDPIAEVGFLCGFSDQSHFTREMQRRVGLPPAAYRAAFARLAD